MQYPQKSYFRCWKTDLPVVRFCSVKMGDAINSPCSVCRVYVSAKVAKKNRIPQTFAPEVIWDEYRNCYGNYKIQWYVISEIKTYFLICVIQ